MNADGHLVCESSYKRIDPKRRACYKWTRHLEFKSQLKRGVSCRLTNSSVKSVTSLLPWSWKLRNMRRENSGVPSAKAPKLGNRLRPSRPLLPAKASPNISWKFSGKILIAHLKQIVILSIASNRKVKVFAESFGGQFLENFHPAGVSDASICRVIKGLQ